jgi:hypothetical protein
MNERIGETHQQLDSFPGRLEDRRLNSLLSPIGACGSGFDPGDWGLELRLALFAYADTAYSKTSQWSLATSRYGQAGDAGSEAVKYSAEVVGSGLGKSCYEQEVYGLQGGTHKQFEVDQIRWIHAVRREDIERLPYELCGNRAATVWSSACFLGHEAFA